MVRLRAGRSRSTPVDATYVDGKICLTCHANQAALFEKTLMGKIGKTQKGKFDCENCHGPGSAHVKAGGGRGVGGIISFRADDTDRGRPKKTMRSASPATTRATGPFGMAARTMSAVSCARIATRS